MLVDERPDKYFVIAGVTSARLVEFLAAEGVVVNVVMRLSCSCRASNYAIDKLQTAATDTDATATTAGG